MGSRSPRHWFEKKLALFSSHLANRSKREAPGEIDIRELRAMWRLMTSGEPATYELADSNFLERGHG